jgi:transcriptional regulator with XRE-family HTH domain
VSSDRSELLVRQVVLLLIQAREEKGISMNKLAWMADVSPKGIAFIEQGKNSPTLRNICRLADALEVSLPTLFAVADEMVPRGKVD